MACGIVHGMEAMAIQLVSVIVREGRAVARARAVAAEARISIEVSFSVPPGLSRSDLWECARDEVLRYLDLAYEWRDLWHLGTRPARLK
jgi:hypothetical protein